MTDIDDALRTRFPEGFGSPMADWVTLKLKEETPGAGSIEKEFEIFAMTQRVESEKVMDQAKAFKLVAYGLLILVLGALGLLAFIVGRLKRNR